MEAWKSFESLSDSDKVKFFEALFGGSEATSSSRDETFQIRSPEKSKLNNILENLKRVSGENSPESNSQVGDSKKQKTLDSWLIKRDDGSSPESKLRPSSNANTSVIRSCSDINNVSEINPYSEKLATNNVDDANSRNLLFEDNKTITQSAKVINNSAVNKDPGEMSISLKDVEKSNGNNEKYNLRSKRKVSKLSPTSEYSDRPVKHFKRKDNQSNPSNINDCDKITDSTLTNHDGTSHGQSSKENIYNMNGLLEKKEFYNLRAKRKNTKQQPNETDNGIGVQGELNSQIKDSMSNRNDQFLNTTSVQSNYEAFCKLRKICSDAGLNITDLLQHEKIQNILSDCKNLYSDAVLFIGSLNSKTGKILPVVHLAESKKKLFESLIKLQGIHIQ